MAEQVQPRHMPHEQLRTEAPAQKDHSDKYVSAFVSGDSFTEMSFRNPVLQASADHFKVGIDELTVNLGNLSMLEYEEGAVLFRVIRRGYTEGLGANETQVSFQMPDAPVSAELIAQLAAANALDPNVVGAAVRQALIDAAQANIVLARAFYRDGFEFKIDRPFLTFHEIKSRMEEVATAVGSFIREFGYDNTQFAGVTWNTEVAAAEARLFEHFQLTTTTNGQIKFSGNPDFWANFLIQIPTPMYREILMNSQTQFICMHPVTGGRVDEPYTIHVLNGTLTSTDPAPELPQGFDPNLSPATQIEFIGGGNMIHNIDRRVTLEVGCSLPLKNSPFIDHGVEAPDFVLGRYMFHKPMSMDDKITVYDLGVRTLQGPRDRVVYHHLAAQQKIQILRLRLWARVRSYDAATGKWGMKTIVCPVQNSDYWFARLHFTRK